MPSEHAELVEVENTPEFKRNLRALAKKYRHIRSDVQPVINQLRVGQILGDQILRARDTIQRHMSETNKKRKKKQCFLPSLSN